MDMKLEHFSAQVEPHRIVYTVHGHIDADGYVDISEVTVNDSIINLWPDFYETSIGDQIQDACDEIAAKRSGNEYWDRADWDFDAAREVA